ncbi:hypothetical protein QW131_25310 [Roseibium salinum]|nr:hypothetical protein [Roseibium salinum]
MKRKLEDGKPRTLAAPPVIGGVKRQTAVDTIDLSARLEKNDYEELKDKYQKKKLSDLSDLKSMSKTGVVLVFQGNDAAGKGGAIRRVIQPLDPRIYKVYPISAPSDEEKGAALSVALLAPRSAKGTFRVFFDRSWYERVLVERVEGFAGHEDWLRAYNEINEFEQELTDFGFIVCKFWLAISEKGAIAPLQGA